MKAVLRKCVRRVAKRYGYAVVGGSDSAAQLAINPILKIVGMQLLPETKVGRTYLEALPTIAKAAEAGKSVPDYVASLWDEVGVIEDFVKFLNSAVPLNNLKQVCEIGAGTGRFLEPIKAAMNAEVYEVYETNSGWSDYLAKTYGVVDQVADGATLANTPDNSRDLVHAHQVFVYLPVRVCFAYFYEMCRVCAPGGYVVFDSYLADKLNLNSVDTWLNNVANYQVLLPRETIMDLFARNGFELVDGDYQMKAYVGNTQYLVFRKRA